jgi:hypothetical protein
LARLSNPIDLLFGEALDDAKCVIANPQNRVKNASVNFQVPVSLTNSGFQFTGRDYTCYTGGVCVPPYVSDGNVGEYRARVEACIPEGSKSKLTKVIDSGGNALGCKTAEGKDGAWYDIAPPWKALTRLSLSNLGGNSQEIVRGVLSVPAVLPNPSNTVRIEIAFGLKDSPTEGFISDLYWGVPDQSGPFGGPETAMTRLAVTFQQPIVVMPAAIVKLKVLPYTIVYRPPGNQSSGTFTATAAFGTAMTAGSSTTFDNTKTYEQSYGVQDGQKVTAFIATVQLADGQTTTNTSAFNDNSVIGKGLTTSSSHSIVRSFTVGSNSTDPSVIPAHEYVLPNTCNTANFSANNCSVSPGENYLQEPFWADRIVLLLDPNAAVWDFNGTSQMQLLGASDFQDVSVADLAACAQNANQDAWKLGNGKFLTPTECAALASLDPFYGVGQSRDPSLSGRGIFVGSGSYGRDAVKPNSVSTVKFSDIFTYQTQRTTNGSASFNATVTNVMGFSWSAGLSLSAKQSPGGIDLGFSNDTTLTQGEKNTTSTSMRIAYTASSTTTDSNGTQIDGNFGDDHNFNTPDCQRNTGACYTPRVRVFIDALFGSYIFQDPDAQLSAAVPRYQIGPRSH